MKFTYTNQQLILEDDHKSYHIPSSDIQRLISRPGTRVLRFEQDGETSSIPLSTAIGEIEGFELLQEALKAL